LIFGEVEALEPSPNASWQQNGNASGLHYELYTARRIALSAWQRTRSAPRFDWFLSRPQTTLVEFASPCHFPGRQGCLQRGTHRRLAPMRRPVIEVVVEQVGVGVGRHRR